MQAALVFSFLFAGYLVDAGSLFATAPVKALDEVEQALKKVTALPHLSASQQKSAKNVVDFVIHTVQEMENSKDLTKGAKAKKVKEAIARLQGLQQQWAVAAGNMTMSERKIGELQSQLAEKRQQLAKAEGMLKLDKLKKELLEKKLLLNKLVAQQAEARQHGAQQKADATAKKDMVKQLSAAATDLAAHTGAVASSKGNNKAAKLSSILSMLRGREHSIQESIKALDDAEKISEDKFNSLASKTANATKDEAVVKAQRMLRNVKKQQHHKIEKAKAAKKAELAEVTDAVKSIEAGDANGVQKVLTKMQGEMRAVDARSRNFIY